MGEDRALDEFLGGDGAGEGDDVREGEEASTDADDDGTGDEEPDTDPEPDEPAGAVSTTAFTPEGAPCEACGTSVRRRWRDDGALVCADCKTW